MTVYGSTDKLLSKRSGVSLVTQNLCWTSVLRSLCIALNLFCVADLRIDPNNANFFHMMFFLWPKDDCQQSEDDFVHCICCKDFVQLCEKFRTALLQAMWLTSQIHARQKTKPIPCGINDWALTKGSSMLKGKQPLKVFSFRHLSKSVNIPWKIKQKPTGQPRASHREKHLCGWERSGDTRSCM